MNGLKSWEGAGGGSKTGVRLRRSTYQKFTKKHQKIMKTDQKIIRNIKETRALSLPEHAELLTKHLTSKNIMQVAQVETSLTPRGSIENGLQLKKDAYYFPHDSNASQDEKILNLRADHGWEGYGVFWAVIERLRDTSNHKYRLDSIKGLAGSLGIKRPVLEEIIKNYDLFEMNEDYFWSPSLTRRMEIVEEKREQAREAGKKSGEARCNKPNAKGKEILTTTTTREEIVEFFRKNVPKPYDPDLEARRFVDMNELKSWEGAGGVENWRKVAPLYISKIHEKTSKNHENRPGNYQKYKRDPGAVFAGACRIVDEIFDEQEHHAGSPG